MSRNPNAEYSLTLRDFDGEPTTTNFNVRAYNVVTFADDLGAFAELKATIEAITMGIVSSERVAPYVTRAAGTLPTDENAQRERKWSIIAQDNTTFDIVKYEIGTALLDGNMIPGSGEADLTATDIAAFVTKFEEVVFSNNGNNLTVLRIEHIGKNT
jgi:hypothetical protein